MQNRGRGHYLPTEHPVWSVSLVHSMSIELKSEFLGLMRLHVYGIQHFN